MPWIRKWGGERVSSGNLLQNDLQAKLACSVSSSQLVIVVIIAIIICTTLSAFVNFAAQFDDCPTQVGAGRGEKESRHRVHSANAANSA